MLHSKQFVKYNQIGPLEDKQIFYTCYIFKYYYKYVYLQYCYKFGIDILFSFSIYYIWYKGITPNIVDKHIHSNI